MGSVFNFEKLVNHDLYHLRYGKGAIVAAIPKEIEEKSQCVREEKQKEMFDLTEKLREQLKIKILDLRERLKDVQAVQETPASIDFVSKTKDDIKSLQNEYRTATYTPKPYISNLKLAKFYAHDIPSRSESITRFDKILRIEELGSHVKIVLSISALPQENHSYHSKVGVVKFLPDRRVSRIEGLVERVLPSQNVTLEVISQPPT